MLWKNGEKQRSTQLDRGCLYGDGFFTTVLVIEGQLTNWSAHWQRLQTSAERLKFPELNEKQLLQLLRQALSESASHAPYSVVKVMVTRGVGGVGYQPPAQVEPTVYIQTMGYPNDRLAQPRHLKNYQAWYIFPQQVIWSDVLAGIQPSIAGLKHMNRLENVLARQALMKSAATEALMMTSQGHCISATQANVGIIQGRCILSPDTQLSGVTGTAMTALKEVASDYTFSYAALSKETIESADEIFLTNAVRGVMPVTQLNSIERSTEQSYELATRWMEAMNVRRL